MSDPQPHDRGQTLAFLSLVYQPGDVFEVRVLGAERPGYRRPHVESGYFDHAHLAQVPAALADLTTATGVYVIPNPVYPALLARAANRIRPVGQEPTTSDADILVRRWLPVDCDPVRPAGIAATDDEHALALAKAAALRTDLAHRGWPEPIATDSGNGGQLLYRVELPANDGGLIKRCLQALAAAGDAHVEIDQAVHNAARLWRLPGTWNRKGDSLPARPHRLATILYAPAAPVVVPGALLAALAPPPAPVAGAPQHAPPAPPVATGDRPGDDYNQRGELGALLAAHGWQPVGTAGENQLWRRPGKATGNHSATFDGHTFYVFSSNATPFAANTGYTPFAVYALLNHGGDFAAASAALATQGYGGPPPAAAAAEPEVDLSRLLLNLLGDVPAARLNGPPDPAAGAAQGQVLTALAAPPCPDPEELLCYRFLCRAGGLLLAAPTGVGKSTWAIQAAILWAGGWAMCGIAAARPLRVAVIQAENDAGDLAEMRDGVLTGLAHEYPPDALHQAASRVTVHSVATPAGLAFARFLEQVIGADQPDLVIIDPVFAYLGADASDQAAVSAWLRNAITPVLQAHRVGLLLVHHSNKPKATDALTFRALGDLAYASSGSNEWANWPRAILAIQRTEREGYFRLTAPKRGGRLHWQQEGVPTCERPIAYARQPGLMYWREPDPGELAAAAVAGPGVMDRAQRARATRLTPGDLAGPVLDWIEQQGGAVLVATLREHVGKVYEVGRDKALEVIRLLIDEHELVKSRAQAGSQRVDAIGHPQPARALAQRVLRERQAQAEPPAGEDQPAPDSAPHATAATLAAAPAAGPADLSAGDPRADGPPDGAPVVVAAATDDH